MTPLAGTESVAGVPALSAFGFAARSTGLSGKGGGEPFTPFDLRLLLFTLVESLEGAIVCFSASVNLRFSSSTCAKTKQSRLSCMLIVTM